MHNKIIFAFIAIAILLLTSLIPLENVTAKKSIKYEEELTKTVEVLIQIYTVDGVKEIRKEISSNEFIKLKQMGNETGRAIRTLFNYRTSSFIEKIRANKTIDSFLYELRKNGLLGDMNVKEVKDLITGEYLQKNSIEMKRIERMAKLLQNNESDRWKINLMCEVTAIGSLIDISPWTLLLLFLLLSFNNTAIERTVFYLWLILDMIPHPTTIGYWQIRNTLLLPANVETRGLLGRKEIFISKNRFEEISVITIGFTGMILVPIAAYGFCPFIAMKKVEYTPSSSLG